MRPRGSNSPPYLLQAWKKTCFRWADETVRKLTLRKKDGCSMLLLRGLKSNSTSAIAKYDTDLVKKTGRCDRVFLMRWTRELSELKPEQPSNRIKTDFRLRNHVAATIQQSNTTGRSPNSLRNHHTPVSIMKLNTTMIPIKPAQPLCIQHLGPEKSCSERDRVKIQKLLYFLRRGVKKL